MKKIQKKGIDYSSIFSNNRYCLFLDIDGTLCDFQLDPNDCFIPPKTLNIIKKILSYCVPIIAVTGRDINSSRKLFNNIELPIVALHGLEIYLNKKERLSTSNNFLEISHIFNMLSKACIPYPELIIENKKSSIALHYRKAPELEYIAKKIISDSHKLFPNLKFLQGKFVFELIPPEANKGVAIKNFLSYLNKTEMHTPIFIGDDVTDEDGFYVVNQMTDSISIKVGQGLTHAKFQLESINHVYDFLELFLEHIQRNKKLSNVKTT